MGYPGKNRKTYEPPSHPWQATRMKEEVGLVKEYGLRNKRELWKAHSTLRKYRRGARKLRAELAGVGKKGEYARLVSKELLEKLSKIGLSKKDAELDEILTLRIEDILERRLQTLVYRQGLANSIKHARQLITHGHIAIDGRKITIPGYIVLKNEESEIEYYLHSPIYKTKEDGDKVTAGA